jgi:hypothetical protein
MARQAADAHVGFIMKSIASLAALALVPLLVLGSSSAWAETNGTSKGNAAKPAPVVGGATVSKTSPPAIGGPSKNTSPGGHVAAPVSSPTIGGPSTSAPPKAATLAPSKPAPAPSMTAPASKPSSPAPNTAKPVHQNL